VLTVRCCRWPLLQGLLLLDRGKLGLDTVAGITLAALGIPEVMGYKKMWHPCCDRPLHLAAAGYRFCSARGLAPSCGGRGLSDGRDPRVDVGCGGGRRAWLRALAEAGIWDQIMKALAAGHDAAVQMIDTSVVRVHQHGACIADNNHQDMGRSRGGLTSKIHAVVATNGLPVHLALTPGEAHDNRLCSVLLSGLLPQTMLLADRGHDADWIRELARQQGAWANIPPKRNRKDPICFSPYLYRARNLIERFFNKIKQCRRVATRYDNLAANYLAFIKLASIRIWLRAYEAAPKMKRKQQESVDGLAVR
jgi:transposase